MHETLDFLTIIDDKIKRSRLGDSKRLQTISTRDKIMGKKQQRYPYARAMDFRQSKYNNFPRWLTQKEGFSDFMYKSYEKKLMSIPLICEKEKRDSDQRYFIALYLQQMEVFKGLPTQVIAIVLDNLKTKYYKPGQKVHDEEETPKFMALIYVGEVQFRSGKRALVREKNDIILRDAFLGRPHPTITCKEQTILLTLDTRIWSLINQTIKKQMDSKDRDHVNDMLRSTFFAELHLHDKKALTFYNSFKVECYFQGQVIQQTGSEEKAFYLIYQGALMEENHIYVREHNKWPLPHRRWEVRAVYNSYNQNKLIRPYSFFGDQEIMENLKFKAKYVANSWTVLLKMSEADFYQHLNQEDIKRLKKYRAENADVNYTDFESQVRARAKSTSERKKIVLKAINTSLVHKSQLSPKKMSLIGRFQKTMLQRVLAEDKKISF